MPRSLFRGLAAVGAGVMLLTWLAGHPFARRSAQKRLVEQGQQSLSRAETLCRTLTPQVGGLSYTTSLIPFRKRDGSTRQHWAVDCVDSTNEMVAHLTWDADTEDFELIVNLPQHTSYGRRKILSAAQALSVARGWISDLGLARKENWQPVAAPKLDANAWQSRWQADHRRVTLLLDAETGELMRARLENAVEPPSAAARQMAAAESQDTGMREKEDRFRLAP